MTRAGLLAELQAVWHSLHCLLHGGHRYLLLPAERSQGQLVVCSRCYMRGGW